MNKIQVMAFWVCLGLFFNGCSSEPGTNSIDRVQGRISVVEVKDEAGALTGWLLRFRDPAVGDGVWFTVPSGVAALTVTSDTADPPLTASVAEWSSITFRDTHTRNSSVLNPAAGSWFLTYSGSKVGESTFAVSLQRSTSVASRWAPVERLFYGEAYAQPRLPNVRRFLYENASNIHDVVSAAFEAARTSGTLFTRIGAGAASYGEGVAVEQGATIAVRVYEVGNGCGNNQRNIDYNRGFTDSQLMIANWPIISQFRRIVTCRLDLSNQR